MSLKPGGARPSPHSPAEEDQLSLTRIHMDPPPGAATGDGVDLQEEVRRSFVPGHRSVVWAHLVFSFQAFLQEQLSYQDAKYPREPSELDDWQPDDTQTEAWTCPSAPRRQEPAETLLVEFCRQQNQIRELREELKQKNVRLTCCSSALPSASHHFCFSEEDFSAGNGDEEQPEGHLIQPSSLQDAEEECLKTHQNLDE